MRRSCLHSAWVGCRTNNNGTAADNDGDDDKDVHACMVMQVIMMHDDEAW